MMGKNNLNCEQILSLISRHQDNDLDKEEAWQVYHHVNLCKPCQIQMEEIASLEIDLSELCESYKDYSLDDRFNMKVRACILKDVHQVRWRPLWARLKRFELFVSFKESPLLPLAVGGIGSFLIFLMLLPQFSSDSLKTRFTVAEIPFKQAKDRLSWNNERTLSPGQSIVYSVNKEDEKSYHFRIVSSEPVPVSFQHDEEEEQELIPVMLNGVRYATLKSPKANDRILIRNNGSIPVRINTHTNRPQSFNVSFKKGSLPK